MEGRIFGADCTTQVNGAKLLELLQKPSGHWSPASSSMLVFGIPLRIEDSRRKQAGYWPHQLIVYCDVTLPHTHCPTNPMLKKCSKCWNEWPLDKFYARKNSADGLNGICKECIGHKSYEWKLNNPVNCLCSNMLAQAKRRAQSSGRNFNLTLKDLQRLVVSHCPVLGTEIVWKYDHGLGLGAHSPSLDRIDNLLGYTKDNVAIISHRANSMKNAATVEELQAILNYMQNPREATSRRARRYCRMKEEHHEVIAQLHSQGKTCREIADLVGPSKSSVAAFIKQFCQ